MRVVQVTSPAPRDVWTRLLDRTPDALAFQSPAWVDCMGEAAGYQDASRLYETDDGRQLVLPMARSAPLPLGIGSSRVGLLASTEASMPYGWGTGGLLASDPVEPAALEAVFADLWRRPALRSAVRPGPLMGDRWAAACPRGAMVVPRRAHVLDLRGGFGHVWTERFSGPARTAVRKAERSPLTVQSDSTGALVPAFYELYERSVERWASQQHEPPLLARWRAARRDPMRKLQIVARRLGAACRVWVASLDDKPVAAIIVLRQGENASYWRGAMDKELAGPHRANDLLHRLAIEAACNDGCSWYQMGESGASDSLAQFKARFGAMPHDYAEYSVERLPVTQTTAALKGVVKRAIRFKD